MKDRFYLYFEKGMPKGTSQQIRHNRKTGRCYKDAKLENSENQFRLALRPHAPKSPSDKPIKLHIWLYFDVKDKKKWGKPKTSTPDADNFSKGFIDQMAKCGFFKNDSQITDLHIEKSYAEKAAIVVYWEEV